MVLVRLPSPDTIDLANTDLILAVAAGAKDTTKGRRIDLAADAATTLRTEAESFVARLLEMTTAQYHPGSEIGANECLAVPHAELDQTGPVYAVLAQARAFEPMTPADLGRIHVPYWFIQMESEAGARHSFIRRGGVRKAITEGRRFFALGDTLTRVTRPLLTLDQDFDVVVTPSGVISRTADALEKLFFDTPALLAQVPLWVDQINTRVPFAGDGAARLVARCQADWRMRRRLVALADAPHMRDLTFATFSAAVETSGIDPTLLVEGEGLRFDDKHPFRALKFLNDEASRGTFTGEPLQFSGRAPF